jgi:hypothetical protein
MTGVDSNLVLFMQSQGDPSELRGTLASVGLKGEGFSDPRAFLQRLKTARPLACVLDLSFGDVPIIIAMLKSVRAVLGPKLPLIGIAQPSASGAPHPAQAQALAVGASAVIPKPSGQDDADALLDLIASSAAEDQEAPATEMPKVARWFFDTMAPPLAGLGEVLCASTDSEELVRFYQDRLAPFREQFVTLVAALRKSETKVDVTQSIRMYGLRNARNLVVALRMSELTGTNLVQWNPKTGLLSGEPAQALKFANKTADHFGEGSRNQLEAFAAGLVLDLLSILAEGAGVRKAALRKFIEDRYYEQMRKADKGIAAGKGMKKLVLERHIATVLLMEPAAEAAMAIFSDEYLELRRKLDKKAIRPVLQHIAELKLLSVSRNLMAALIAQGAPGLDEASRAALFFEYPDLVGALPHAEDSHDLVQVCRTV